MWQRTGLIAVLLLVPIAVALGSQWLSQTVAPPTLPADPVLVLLAQPQP